MAGHCVARVDQALLERAAEFAEGFELRGPADRVRQIVGPALSYASFDNALNRFAKLLGMRLPDFIPEN